MTKVLSYVAAMLPSGADYRDVGRTWRRDLLAGITVGIVALPLALGFGVSSGLTAEAGLITAIVAGVLAAVIGGSHVQVSGPTGAMVVILVPIVASYGVGAVAAVSMTAGIIVVVAGLLKLGRAVSFIPWPVIEGFTLGIAVIIFMQQVPFVTSGHQVAAGEHSANAVVAAIESIASADRSYVLWALAAVAIVATCMLGATKLHPSLPGSLIGIAVVTVLVLVTPAPLSTIGVLPSSLPAPSFPALNGLSVTHLVSAALTVAALAGIESLLSARVAASLADTGRYDADRELVGQGVASIGSAMFGGMPATGAIARTAVNVRSGGRSRLASITHAALLLLIVLVAAGPVSHIPLAALGGVLMITAIRMVHLATVSAILRSTRSDALGFVVTALVTVSVDLIVAVGIGVLCAGIFAIRNLSRASGVHREEIGGDAQPGDERIAVARLDGPLFFAAADRVFDEVTNVEDVSVVVLRMSQLELVDATGARILSDIVTMLERRGVTVLIKGVQPGHEELFRRVGVLRALRHHKHLFVDLDEAIEHARSHIRRERGSAERAPGFEI